MGFWLTWPRLVWLVQLVQAICVSGPAVLCLGVVCTAHGVFRGYGAEGPCDPSRRWRPSPSPGVRACDPAMGPVGPVLFFLGLRPQI